MSCTSEVTIVAGRNATAIRFALDRRGCAATSKNRSAIFVEPEWVRPHTLHGQK
jgi:hypothetical protein